jgi:hypothetical protein
VRSAELKRRSADNRWTIRFNVMEKSRSCL